MVSATIVNSIQLGKGAIRNNNEMWGPQGTVNRVSAKSTCL